MMETAEDLGGEFKIKSMYMTDLYILSSTNYK